LLNETQSGSEGGFTETQTCKSPDEIIASCRCDEANEKPEAVVDPPVSFKGGELLLRCFGSGLGYLRRIDLDTLEMIKKIGPRFGLG
jgi:hypothetical protein